MAQPDASSQWRWSCSEPSDPAFIDALIECHALTLGTRRALACTCKLWGDKMWVFFARPELYLGEDDRTHDNARFVLNAGGKLRQSNPNVVLRIDNSREPLFGLPPWPEEHLLPVAEWLNEYELFNGAIAGSTPKTAPTPTLTHASATHKSDAVLWWEGRAFSRLVDGEVRIDLHADDSSDLRTRHEPMRGSRLCNPNWTWPHPTMRTTRRCKLLMAGCMTLGALERVERVHGVPAGALDLSHKRVDDAGALAVARAIGQWHMGSLNLTSAIDYHFSLGMLRPLVSDRAMPTDRLCRLVLDECVLAVMGVRMLARAAQKGHFMGLGTLSMARCQLSQGHVRELIPCFKECGGLNRLLTLVLRQNDIDSQCMEQWMQQGKCLVWLKALDLEHNPSVSDHTWGAFGMWIKNHSRWNSIVTVKVFSDSVASGDPKKRWLRQMIDAAVDCRRSEAAWRHHVPPGEQEGLEKR